MTFSVNFQPANKLVQEFEGDITYVLQSVTTSKSGKMSFINIKVCEKTYEKANADSKIQINVTISAYKSGDIANLSVKEVGI